MTTPRSALTAAFPVILIATALTLGAAVASGCVTEKPESEAEPGSIATDPAGSGSDGETGTSTDTEREGVSMPQEPTSEETDGDDGARRSVDEGFEPLIQVVDGRATKHGWNQYGPGYFLIDPDRGILESHGGMGLFWHSARKLSDFVLELEYRTTSEDTNSGVFLRVPDVPTSNDYIYRSFEIQIHDAAGEATHRTGAVYDVVPPEEDASLGPGAWNRMRIRFEGDHLTVALNGTRVIDWIAEPGGKVEAFADSGYIGLQNHDERSRIDFRDLRIRDLR